MSFQKVFILSSIALLATSVAWVVRELNPPWLRYQEAYYGWLRAGAPETTPASFQAQRFYGLQQVGVKALQRVDRCTTCHPGVADPRAKEAPPMFRFRPVHAQHPMEKFGCTICHRGQGRATEVPDAHGEAPFWDQPLLRGVYLQAACGQCHRQPLPKQAPLLEEGRQLFEAYGCRNCHRLDGRGRQVGPDLAGVGSKAPEDLMWGDDTGPRTLPNWLLRHFKDPRTFQPNSPMTDFRLNDAQATALTVYMLSLTVPEMPRALLPSRSRPAPETEEGA